MSSKRELRPQMYAPSLLALCPTWRSKMSHRTQLGLKTRAHFLMLLLMATSASEARLKTSSSNSSSILFRPCSSNISQRPNGPQSEIFPHSVSYWHGVNVPPVNTSEQTRIWQSPPNLISLSRYAFYMVPERFCFCNEVDSCRRLNTL